MWTVIFTIRFDQWFDEQDEDTQEKILADLSNLETHGPKLSRPYADTLNSSKYRNMKELWIQHDGRPIRVDPIRRAIILRRW